MKTLFRGFCRSKDGKETIYLNDEEVKGNWVYGFYFDYDYDCTIRPCIGTSPLSANDYSEIYSDCYAEVIPETVSEAVRGLTDKNGRHLFDEDLLRDSGGLEFVIYYDEDDLCWRGVSLAGNDISIHNIKCLDFEVIGTKWDKRE